MDRRPDIIDLIGPEFDAVSEQAASRTLVICAAPRTGSYELCRFLTAAGIGVPHEYFHPTFALPLAERWRLEGDPLSSAGIDEYARLLRRRRIASDVFATKLQYWQFNQYLRNGAGEELLTRATVVHLFRPDAANQFASWRLARATGRWDHSERRTSEPYNPGDGDNQVLQQEVEFMISEDSGFRRLFIMLDIQPVFVTFAEIIKSPRNVVERIANALDVSIKSSSLDDMISLSEPYSQPAEAQANIKRQLAKALHRCAFPNSRS